MGRIAAFPVDHCPIRFVAYLSRPEEKMKCGVERLGSDGAFTDITIQDRVDIF